MERPVRHWSPAPLFIPLAVAIAVGCVPQDDRTDSDKPSGTTAQSATEGQSETETEPGETITGESGSTHAGSTGSGSAADGTEGETSDGPPPAKCLSGKVGVFDVNTDPLYADDSDFVVHSYPSNSPDDSPASSADFFAKVEADPSVDNNFLFASGFSYGATMSLIHGYMSSDKLAGIIHLSQYSNPTHFEEELYAAARRIPVYIIHDDSYDGGGQALRQYLHGVGYEDGVDLFYLDFVGGHSAPSPVEMQTVLDWMKTMGLGGPCEE